jgi:hypothetical protein
VGGNSKIRDLGGTIARVATQYCGDRADVGLQSNAALAPEQGFALDLHKLLGLAQAS